MTSILCHPSIWSTPSWHLAILACHLGSVPFDFYDGSSLRFKRGTSGTVEIMGAVFTLFCGVRGVRGVFWLSSFEIFNAKASPIYSYSHANMTRRYPMNEVFWNRSLPIRVFTIFFFTLSCSLMKKAPINPSMGAVH